VKSGGWNPAAMKAWQAAAGDFMTVNPLALG